MVSLQSIALLGATGSIGSACLDVVRMHGNCMRVAGMTAYRSHRRLQELATEFRPDWAAIEHPDGNSDAFGAEISGAKTGQFDAVTQWHCGLECVESLVRRPDIDVVVTAVVGAAGLPATWAAVDAGKRVALANKEALVVAGALIMGRASETGARIIPVDSEHSAVFQCLQAGQNRDVRRIVLTASGGPFRNWDRSQMRDVTPEMALKHPTWTMGAKITVDSATMMNKALEIIEARWLFGLSPDQISVVVHPQSVIHSFVEYSDGSVISQLSPPDMRLPIQYALTFPRRLECPTAQFDWTATHRLEFSPPDLEAFPALRLGFDVARSGGTSGAVLNAANETAVERFLKYDLRFDQITSVVEAILKHHDFDASPSLEQLLHIDKWARKEALKWYQS